eukprot:gene30577-5475_t
MVCGPPSAAAPTPSSLLRAGGRPTLQRRQRCERRGGRRAGKKLRPPRSQWQNTCYAPETRPMPHRQWAPPSMMVPATPPAAPPAPRTPPPAVMVAMGAPQLSAQHGATRAL